MSDERSLIERAAEGDADAFARLVDPHLAVARRVARSAGAASDDDDVVQNALVKAYRSLDRFDAGREFRPWFLTIVRNEAHNHTRAVGRRTRAEARVAAGEPDVPSAEDAAVRSVERESVLAAVARLSPIDRETIESRFLAEDTEAEAAVHMGVAVGTVKSRTNRALHRLRVALVVLLVALAALLVPPVRRAVASWLGLRGVRIERRSEQPIPASSATSANPTAATAGTTSSSAPTSTPATTTSLAGPPFGRLVALDEARRALPFAFGVPSDLRLGRPDAVTLEPDVGDGLVTLWWRTGGSLAIPPGPASDGWTVTFSALRGSPSDISFTKLLPDGSTVESVNVGGDGGFWIAGAPHEVAVTVGDQFVVFQNHLATNTLLWQHGEVTYRIEADTTKEVALALAASVG